MAIRFSTKEQPATAAKPARSVSSTDAKKPAARASGKDSDLFEAEAVKPAAKGRKKK